MNLFRNIQHATAKVLYRAARVIGLKDPDRWLSWFGGNVSSSGEAVNHQTAMRLTAVYACVKVIGESVASLPGEVFERLSPKGRRLAANRPEHYLIHNQPNTNMTAFTFWLQMMVHALLRGNGYARIIRDADGMVESLKFYPSWDVSVYPFNQSKDDYIYWFPDVGATSPEDVIHIKGMGWDGIVGISVLTHHAEIFGNGLAADKMQGRYFRHGTANGPGWYETPEGVDVPKAREISDMIGEKYSGERAFKHMVLPRGLKFHSVSISQKDAQYLETRKFNVEEIARIFNVPLHKIKSMGAATRANVEQQNIEFITDTLRPWIKQIEQELDRKLFGKGSNYFVRFNLDAMKRGDMQTRANYYSVMRYIGALNANEIRDMEGWNPREDDGGSDYLQPTNMYATDQLNAMIKKLAAEAEKVEEELENA